MSDINVLFTIPLIKIEVKDDTSELLSCKQYYTSTVQNKNPEEHDILCAENRVLERYPKSKKIFTDIFDSVAKDQLGIDNKFIITTSWMTQTKPGEKSHIHNHKNCYFSGVYYYDEYEDDVGPIEFYNPLEDLSSYSLNSSCMNPFTAGSLQIKPQSKTLLLFPSFLKHSIVTHSGKNVRKSLAFNYAPIDDYGVGDSTYMQSWMP